MIHEDNRNVIPGIRWTSSTKWVDIDTGEEIVKRTKEETKQEVKNKYIIIKIKKHGETNLIQSKGHIEYTIECRRNPQGELKFN